MAPAEEQPAGHRAPNRQIAATAVITQCVAADYVSRRWAGQSRPDAPGMEKRA